MTSPRKMAQEAAKFISESGFFLLRIVPLLILCVIIDYIDWGGGALDSQTSNSQDTRFLAFSQHLQPVRYGFFEDLGPSGFTHPMHPVALSPRTIAATQRAPRPGDVQHDHTQEVNQLKEH